ncbi:MAG: hypothetical protein VYE77_02960 [Planctomycetota bacterium]|nr:hypothetical protein [Planctomycetota bacterium]
MSVEYGRLVDVYGLRETQVGAIISRYERDVIVGSDIQDERGPGDNRPDSEVLYDFIGTELEALQPRLFIPRVIGSEEFDAAFEALDDNLRLVTPQVAGQLANNQEYTLVPRNGAIRLTFSRDLGVDTDFFELRGPLGNVIGVRNAEAVQILEITGDPTQPGNFAPIPVRVVANASRLILDPVLLGEEGLRYQTRNNASGLPASPDNTGANIRIAMALEGSMAIPSLRDTTGGQLTGLNNSGRQSIIRDFRSGNNSDDTPEISRGFVRDPEPPRLVGNIRMYLERVDPVNEFTLLATIYKDGVIQEIDRGDVFNFVTDSSGIPFASAEVVADPEADRGQPEVQHVPVRIRLVPNLESIDPSNQAGYPTNPSDLEAWLVQNAPKAVLVAEYQGGLVNEGTGEIVGGDDPRNFIRFSPEPLPYADGTPSEPDQNISPFAGAVLQFTKPIDLRSAKWADTVFFATRNVLDEDAINEFIATREWQRFGSTGVGGPSGIGMDPSTFDVDKFRTPHLIGSRIVDEDGSQTSLRLQPLMGFHLDDPLRTDGNRPYFLHLVTGDEGVTDLSGNAIDLQTNSFTAAGGLVIPFTLDVRSPGTSPNFENNLVVSVVRRFESRDEDPQPSYYIPSEIQGFGDDGANARSFGLADLYGAFVLADGKLQARPTTRLRRVVDNLNQAPIASQESILRWCPEAIQSEQQTASNSATTPFGAGIQNPLNPYGCRLQTLWREVDLSLSRVDPFDFNLDIERLYWAPFASGAITFDEFDSLTLYLGHSERRPEPCVGNFSALASLPDSGLQVNFDTNFVRNMAANVSNTIESRPTPHSAYLQSPAPMRIDSSLAVYEPNGINRYLPLPELRKPYFVYRDETLIEQGCVVRSGSDQVNGINSFIPYIISPWPNGVGRRAVQSGDDIEFVNGFWNNANNYKLRSQNSPDAFTEGLVGNIALPLLADFWTGCDSAELPAGNGYVAFGTNGWQISITLQSGAQPNFRVLSAGHPQWPTGTPELCVSPASNRWEIARGGWTPPAGGTGNGSATASADNSLYWMMFDFLKRQSVITAGFVDLYNPHRVPLGFADSRLGPFFLNPVTGALQLPAETEPEFAFEVDPPLSLMPGGTSVAPQFRAASAVDSSPWYWKEWVDEHANFYPAVLDLQLKPDETNFPLDPFKAADAHIRKFDDRFVGGASRNWWTHFYNTTVTGYVQDPNTLMDLTYLSQYAGPGQGFTARDVRYVNWRYLMTNNTEATPPVAPAIETFALSYRFEKVQ